MAGGQLGFALLVNLTALEETNTYNMHTKYEECCYRCHYMQTVIVLR
jgi:hypothetical protein